MRIIVIAITLITLIAVVVVSILYGTDLFIPGIKPTPTPTPTPTLTSTPTTHEWTLTQLTFSGCQAALPSISADGTKIAFTALVGDDDYEIFIINSDGSGLTQLTSNTVGHVYPWISADGTKIVFMSIEYTVSMVENDDSGIFINPDDSETVISSSDSRMSIILQ